MYWTKGFDMKKICLNCEFCDVAYPDIDVLKLKEEDDYLVCLDTKEKVEDNFTCKKYKKSKGREADLKVGC